MKAPVGTRINFCFALLLTAGVVGWGVPRASAGDKIIYTSATDTLTAPAVDRPDADANKPLPAQFQSLDPVGGDAYYFAPATVTVLPARQNSHDLLSPQLDPFRENSSGLFGKTPSLDSTGDPAESQDENSSSQRGAKGERGAWGDPNSSDSPRTSQSSTLDFGSFRNEANDPASKRQRAFNQEFGIYDKPSSLMRDSYNSAESQKASLSELIKRFQPMSSYGSDPYGEKGAYGLSQKESSTTAGADQPLFSGSEAASQPNDTASALDPFGSGLTPAKSSKEGTQSDYAPEMRAWSEPQAVRPPTVDYHKSFVPPSENRDPGQSHPGVLSFPKKPGSVFN